MDWMVKSQGLHQMRDTYAPTRSSIYSERSENVCTRGDRVPKRPQKRRSFIDLLEDVRVFLHFRKRCPRHALKSIQLPL